MEEEGTRHGNKELERLTQSVRDRDKEKEQEIKIGIDRYIARDI